MWEGYDQDQLPDKNWRVWNHRRPLACDRCWEQRGKYRPSEAAFHGRILAYMAGRQAEKELLEECRGGDGDDQYQIALMLTELYPAELHDKFERR